MRRTMLVWLAVSVVQLAVAQTPAALKSKLPTIKGWQLEPTVETFDGNTLWERINGAASGYLLYDFQEMTVFVYRQAKGNDYITIQIYRHGTHDDAFGIYSTERPLATNFVGIGAEGYQEDAILNFFVDQLYVKIESPSSAPETVKAITQIAQAFAKKINPKAGFPAQLLIFPAKNKIAHSELFVATSFLGHEFLHDAFVADYQQADYKYQVFVIDAGTTADAKALLEKYYRFTKQTDPLNEGRLTIKDKYNGDLECQWKGQYVWGILNDNQFSIEVGEILDAVGNNLTLSR